MLPPFRESPPENICILRLSAIGDICHVLPIVRTIQTVWPGCKITWIIGALESTLVSDIPGIEFIIFNKARGLRAYIDLYRQLRGRRFQVLLHMQMSLRASLASLLVSATYKLGFDRSYAKDFQWLFTNQKIAPKPCQHVMETFFEFIVAVGIPQRILRWDIPISATDTAYSARQIRADSSVVVISPCSSMSYRNWTPLGYAEVADYAANTYGATVVVCGGKTPLERKFSAEISFAANTPILDLVGKTTLKQLLALLKRATVLIAPDSGPAHMATAVNTPVIGLYACTNPDRARPYNSRALTIDRYQEAVFAKYGKSTGELTWGIRVREAGTMDRITVADVTQKLDLILRPESSELIPKVAAVEATDDAT